MNGGDGVKDEGLVAVDLPLPLSFFEGNVWADEEHGRFTAIEFVRDAAGFTPGYRGLFAETLAQQFIREGFACPLSLPA